MRDYRNHSSYFIQRLWKRIILIIHQLKQDLTTVELKRVIVIPAFFFMLGNFNVLNAQNFDNPSKNPFGLTSGNQFSVPVTADIDADGDPDVFVLSYQGNIRYYKNEGTSNNPTFAQKIDNPFNIGRTGYLGGMSLADLDGDGDLDFIVGSGDGEFWYSQNEGTQTEPMFANKIINPFGLQSVSYYCFPTFVDLDDDGDFDILAFEEYGVVQYFENTGTQLAPAFAAPKTNPFGIEGKVKNALSPTFADLDEDGDFDLMVGDFYSSNFTFFENTGTAKTPAFAPLVLNPFQITSTNKQMVLPHFSDLDGDGDMDLITGEDNGDLYYYKNATHTSGVFTFKSSLPAIFPNPATDVVNFTNYSEIAHIELINGTGQTTIFIDGPIEQLVLDGQYPGVYILRIQMKDDNVLVKKLIKH